MWVRVRRGGGGVDGEEGEKKMSKWEGILVDIFSLFLLYYNRIN
jgi:hypothetical protein